MLANYNGVQIFVATTGRARAELGDKVLAWVSEARVEVVGQRVLQSSSDAFHCLTILLFWRRQS